MHRYLPVRSTVLLSIFYFLKERRKESTRAVFDRSEQENSRAGDRRRAFTFSTAQLSTALLLCARSALPLLAVAALLIGAGCGESVPRIEITEVIDNEDGTLSVKYTAKEFFDSDIDIVANYTTETVILGVATSKGGDGTAGITTSSSGIAHTFVWDYKTDLGIGRHRGITFVIVPYGPDGRGRSGIAGPIDAGLPLLFTANQGADTVSVVDVGAGQVSSTASAGDTPEGIIALPDESKLYVTNGGDDTVSIIDIDDPTIVISLAVGATPMGLAVSPDGSRVFVVNSGDGSVSVIDSSLTSPAVVDTFTVGATPAACSLTENGDCLFVTNSGDDTVSILATSDGSSLILPVSAGSNPQGIATGSRYTVVCNYDSGTVSVIDNTAIVTSPPQVAVDSEPVAVVVDALSAFAYVANYDSDSISVVNLDVLAVVGTINLSGGGPMGVAGPRALTLEGSGIHLYVAYRKSSQVAQVDVSSLSILSTFSVGANPIGIVILSE